LGQPRQLEQQPVTTEPSGGALPLLAHHSQMTSIPDPSSDAAAKLGIRLGTPSDVMGGSFGKRELGAILDRLNKFNQRATYGAVAHLVGLPPMSLMAGRPRDPLHSWVVNGSTHLPTGYDRSQTHPNLLERDRVLSNADDLNAWLLHPE